MNKLKIELIRDKKADERYLSPWMFLIWAIIGISMIIGVLQFYNVIADVRGAESNALGIRILDCLKSDFNYSEISGKDFDIFSKCNLNQAVLEGKDFFYFNLTIINSSGAAYPIIRGNGLYQVMCDTGRSDNVFPLCSSNSLMARDKSDNQQYSLKILAASNQR